MDNKDANEHLLRWQDRLQDIVDGALSATKLCIVTEHLSECSLCRAQHLRLQQVDTQLHRTLATSPVPSSRFDARVLADISAAELTMRAHSRQRELRNHRERLKRLSGGWRAFWRFHLGNVLGAAMVAIALVSVLAATWVDWTERLIGALPLPALVTMSIATAALAFAGVKLSERPIRRLS